MPGYARVSNPPEYYDHVAFSERRRSKNPRKSFDVNSFVTQVVAHMKEKHMEYEKARFKSFTRFEEKCDFIDNVVFPAMRACSDKQTDENVKTLVDAFEQGVSRFTTFGNMSGLAQIFESAYFSLTSMTPTMVRDDYGAMVQKNVATVNTTKAQFEMSKEAASVVSCEEPVVTKAVEVKTSAPSDSKNVVVGVPINRQDARNMQTAGKAAAYGRFFDHVAFFAMMAQVRVPQGPVDGQVVEEVADSCDGKQRCAA